VTMPVKRCGPAQPYGGLLAATTQNHDPDGTDHNIACRCASVGGAAGAARAGHAIVGRRDRRSDPERLQGRACRSGAAAGPTPAYGSAKLKLTTRAVSYDALSLICRPAS